MIKINLLPVRQARKAEAARREVMLLLAGGAVVLLGCLTWWALSSAQLASINAENGALQAEINRLNEDVKKVDEMEKFKDELERKLAVIKDLRDKKGGPVHMLDELANATPERVVLTSVKEKSETIELEGISVSNEVISQFLRALEASPYFDQVYLKDIEALPKGPKDSNLSVLLKKFQLTAHLVTPESEKPDDAKKADAPGAAADAAAPAAPPADAPAPAPAGGGA